MSNRKLLEKKLFASGHVCVEKKKKGTRTKGNIAAILTLLSVNKK